MTIGMILVFFEQYIVAMKILIFISFLEVTFSFFFIFYPLYSGSGCVYSNVGFVSYGYLLLQNLAVKLIMTPELRYCASLKRDKENFLQVIQSKHSLMWYLSVGFHLFLFQIHIPFN